MSKENNVVLRPDDLPSSWYNIQADLPTPPPPLLNPQTHEPVGLHPRIWAEELCRQENSTERYISIPEELQDAYRTYRPTLLYRAKRLEEFLKTPAQIYLKCEQFSPTGSHKPNTALAQAYYVKKQGIERVTTETGAGQWGSALAMSSSLFGLKCRVFMVRASYDQKPGRRIIMETYGAEVYPSPSDQTKFGKGLLAKNPNNFGSLGIAISEALEETLSNDNTRYCLGSVLNHVLMHQTIVGLEAKKQFEMIDVHPDVVVGCIGGGSNFGGFAFPFMRDKLKGDSNVEFVACESKAVPHTTKGVYTYDFGDTAEMAPLAKMYTLGHTYACPPIHAGGLRYHGMAPLISYFIKNGYMKSVAYHQNEVFEAARTLAQTEGIITAPESAHCLKYAIDEALRCRRTGEKRVIAFNHSGHGLLDLSAYQGFLAGELTDFEPEPSQIPSYVSQ